MLYLLGFDGLVPLCLVLYISQMIRTVSVGMLFLSQMRRTTILVVHFVVLARAPCAAAAQHPRATAPCKVEAKRRGTCEES